MRRRSSDQRVDPAWLDRPAYYPGWREPLGAWLWRFDGSFGTCWINYDGHKFMARALPKQKPGRSKQDYQTPSAFLAAVKHRLSIVTFDIDLAASGQNTAARRYYSEAQNALVQPWKVGLGWNWLNPPFANIGPWAERAWLQSQEGAQTAMLVPAGVGANWFRDFVHGKAQVLLLNGRITFVGETMPYPKDCCLLLYGPHVTPVYTVWTWPKQIAQVAA